jgi:hypothetical protein
MHRLTGLPPRSVSYDTLSVTQLTLLVCTCVQIGYTSWNEPLYISNVTFSYWIVLSHTSELAGFMVKGKLEVKLGASEIIS